MKDKVIHNPKRVVDLNKIREEGASTLCSSDKRLDKLGEGPRRIK